MKIQDVPFCTIDWAKIEPTTHKGIQGEAYWRTFEMGNIRVRMVEYSAGYLADHWCSKGHVVLVLQGTFITELSDGRKITMSEGMSYQVADDTNPHRSYSENGVTLFIVD